MPYIPQENRAQVLAEGAETEGELNFEITHAVNRYLRRFGVSYAVINEIVGALEGAKLEFARRVMYPYEDEKRRTNGDVY